MPDLTSYAAFLAPCLPINCPESGRTDACHQPRASARANGLRLNAYRMRRGGLRPDTLACMGLATVVRPRPFRQGVICNLTNPKSLSFLLAILPSCGTVPGSPACNSSSSSYR